MKLFVWNDGGTLTGYTSGMVCALAPDLETALRVIDVTDNIASGNFPAHKPSYVVDLGECSESPPPAAWTVWGGG